ncbi:protein LPA2 [Silene latifolia]|uniref:protein LPA2 n=1 Tax=Silene latifolia TaxID=37657 RepID=UPI003D77C2F8
MTLLLNYPSSCFTNKLLHHTTNPKSIKFTIISQNSPQSQEPTITNDPITKPTPSSGLGFGSAQQPKPNSTPPSSSSSSNGGKKKGRKDIIRRNPVEKPAFLGKKSGSEEIKESSLNESAFLLTWLVLGGLIFVEGIALSVSGFLPEKWDKLFVKYVYPSFTPTVFLFVAASVVYGVIKYFENENARSPK